jgi:hypothetical protein
MDPQMPMPDSMQAAAPPMPAAPPTYRGTAPIYRVPPAWPMVLGVIGIVLGSFGALQGAGGVLSAVFMKFFTGYIPQSGPGAMGMQQSMMQFQGAQVALGFLTLGIGVLLIIASVSLVRRRRTGVTLTKIWALAKLVLGGLTVVLTYWIQKAQIEAMAKDGAPVPVAFANAMLGFGVVLTFGWMAVWPVFCFIWYARRSVKEEVARWSTDTGSTLATPATAHTPHAL